MKENADVCCPILKEMINDMFNKNEFPNELKVADVTPVFKKDDSTNVKNYRPISVLPVTSKILE